MVTLVLALLAAAAQPAPPQRLPAKICMLVTPGGDNVEFQILRWDDSGDHIGLLATQGSVWPTRTIPGSRTALDPDPASERRFALGGRDGVVLELGEPDRSGQWQTVTLFRRDGRRSGLPLAFGSCREGQAPIVFRAMDPAADPSAIGADIPAFDPQSWPRDNCALLTNDGRRLPVSYRLLDARRVQIAGAGLWGRRVMTVERRQGSVRRGRPSTSRFGRRGAPSGFETFFVQENPPRAVKLLSFEDLGGASGSSRSGFAMCGYDELVRRAAPQ